jgi:hypothetical protein
MEYPRDVACQEGVRSAQSCRRNKVTAGTSFRRRAHVQGGPLAGIWKISPGLTCTLLQRLAAAAQGNGEAENSVRAAIKKKMPSAKSILVPTIA